MVAITALPGDGWIEVTKYRQAPPLAQPTPRT
jgi:hypothetical protein